MANHKENEDGFTHILGLVLLLLVIIATVFVFLRVRSRPKTQSTLQNTAQSTVSKPAVAKPDLPEVTWHTIGGGEWQPSSTPPACPAQPIFATPVDLSLATSILYPGQVRGNAFKPHGGFRFDHQPNNDITVTVPMDAKLMRGSKGLFAENGEVQYGFEFIAPCGIWYAFGHLNTLSPKFAAYADKLPLISDHATQQLYDIPGSPDVKKGDVIATQVGITFTKNVFVEWAVLDLRQKNGFTIRPEWAKYSDQFDQHGVCWLDMIPAKDSQLAKSLPGGDSVSGKKSDYCK